PAMPPSLSRPGPTPGRGPACGRSAARRWNSSAVSSPRSGVEGTVTGRTTSMPSRSATRTEGVSAGADHPLGGALLADPQPRRAGARSLVTGPCSHPAAGPAGSLRGRPVEAGLPLLAVRRQALAGVRPTEAEELVGQRGVQDRGLGPVPVVERVLRPADGLLGAAAQPLGDLERGVVDGFVVDAQRDESDAHGLLAAERLAGEQVVLGLGHAAQPRPADG